MVNKGLSCKVQIKDHFYYFGAKAIDIPTHLFPIIKQGQAHKSNANEPYKLDFVDWLEKTPYDSNVLHGKPQFSLDFSKHHEQKCLPSC
ncbi:hypothetical protein [Maribacter sp. IgM3_T14_3]|uniref:Nmad2 family putative nucleotide modification protein n=1 Tax=Maribacter sp. IgM3_T14_3 TaxID=3415140 RepID=UPI003C6ED3B6